MSPFRLSAVLGVICSLVSSVLSQTPSRDNRQGTASITGRVTVSGKPAVNATVTVTEVNSRPQHGNIRKVEAAEPKETIFQRMRTDESGRYRFTGLPAGSYQIKPHSLAYIPEDGAVSLDSVKQITLDEGEKRENVDFALMLGSVITGRVSEADGRPIIAKHVKLIVIDKQGQKREYPASYLWQMFGTDDRGVYRLYGLPPGRYLLSIGGEDDFSSFGGWAKKYPRTYHPDATDESLARVIEIKEGEEVTDVDIRLGSAKKTYEAVGRVIDAETGQPIPHLVVMCAALDNNANSGGDFGGFSITDSQGKFRITGLIPKRYVAVITRPETDSGEREYYHGKTTFEITDSDLSGIEVKGDRAASLSGVVVLEGSSNPAVRTILHQAFISAIVKQDPGSTETDRFTHNAGHSSAKIGIDGSFRISGLLPGKVMFHISSPQTSGFSILRVERNQVEMRDGIPVGRGEKVTGVQIVVLHSSGVIRGQVRIDGGKLPEAARLNVLVRDTRQDGHTRFTEADEKGAFIVDGLMPGEYEVSVQVRTGLNPLTGEGRVSTEPGQQLVRVANGAETQVTLTLDLRRMNQQKQQ